MNKRIERYESARAAYQEALDVADIANEEASYRRDRLNAAQARLTVEDIEEITRLNEKRLKEGVMPDAAL